MSTRPTINKQWHLVSRPRGEPDASNFALVAANIPSLADGEVLVRNHFLSLDPYMRGRMNDTRSYAPPQPLNQVMIGATAGEVVESRHANYAVGDHVLGGFGWQQFGTSDGAGLRKVDVSRIPLSAYLGPVGMPGVTAWIGLEDIIAPKKGETIVVSAASGAVGSVVGQLAKAKGCRVVGIAGGPEKCALVVSEYGFDACVDYKSASWSRDLEAATPHGIDGDFENVGGATFDAVLGRMNPFGRIAVCGLIAGYNGEPMPITNIRSMLTNRLKMQGFIVSEHLPRWPQALGELATAVASGALKYRETIAEGIESAPAAFFGMLKGKNVGKQLVRMT